MAKLADAADLKSADPLVGRMGSIPISCIECGVVGFNEPTSRLESERVFASSAGRRLYRMTVALPSRLMTRPSQPSAELQGDLAHEMRRSLPRRQGLLNCRPRETFTTGAEVLLTKSHSCDYKGGSSRGSPPWLHTHDVPLP